MVDLWEAMGLEVGWNFIFVRHFYDWEMDEVQSFLRVINSKSIRPQLRDRLH